jgi:hypothetical protein
MKPVMRTTLKLSLTVTAILIGSLVGNAQEIQSKIESSIKSKESGWELAKKEVGPESTIYRWKSGSDRVTMEAFVLDSSQSAEAKLKEFTWRVPVPPKERLQEPGDQAVLYQGAVRKSCMLLYRRSHVFVQLNSNTPENATRFARHIDDVLDPK